MTPKEKIIAASTDLFLINGIKGITMDDVSSNVGMSKRTIYEHFENKRELISACVDHIHQQQEQMTDELVNKDQGVIDELFLLIEPIDRNTARQQKFNSDIKRYYPEIFEARYIKHYATAISKLRDRIQRGINEGVVLPSTNLDFSAYVIMEILYGLVSRPEGVVPTRFSINESMKYVIIFFFRGISTAKGMALIDEKLEKYKK